MDKHTQNIYKILEKEDAAKLVEILKIRQQLMEKIDSIDSQLLSFLKEILMDF